MLGTGEVLPQHPCPDAWPLGPPSPPSIRDVQPPGMLSPQPTPSPALQPPPVPHSFLHPVASQHQHYGITWTWPLTCAPCIAAAPPSMAPLTRSPRCPSGSTHPRHTSPPWWAATGPWPALQCTAGTRGPARGSCRFLLPRSPGHVRLAGLCKPPLPQHPAGCCGTRPTALHPAGALTWSPLPPHCLSGTGAARGAMGLPGAQWAACPSHAAAPRAPQLSIAQSRDTGAGASCTEGTRRDEALALPAGAGLSLTLRARGRGHGHRPGGSAGPCPAPALPQHPAVREAAARHQPLPSCCPLHPGGPWVRGTPAGPRPRRAPGPQQGTAGRAPR